MTEQPNNDDFLKKPEESDPLPPQQSDVWGATPPSEKPSWGPPHADPTHTSQPTLAKDEHPQGTLILVMGILGLVLCQLLAPVAWLMGQSARKEVAKGDYRETPMLTIGWVLGIVGTIFLILFVLFFAVLILAGAFAVHDVSSSFDGPCTDLDSYMSHGNCIEE